MLHVDDAILARVARELGMRSMPCGTAQKTMNAESRKIRNLYLVLSQFIWLPTSLIVGVNTLFLLDGGLNNVEAFAANAI
jgi:hypothetical protein